MNKSDRYSLDLMEGCAVTLFLLAVGTAIAVSGLLLDALTR